MNRYEAMKLIISLIEEYESTYNVDIFFSYVPHVNWYELRVCPNKWKAGPHYESEFVYFRDCLSSNDALNKAKLIIKKYLADSTKKENANGNERFNSNTIGV